MPLNNPPAVAAAIAAHTAIAGAHHLPSKVHVTSEVVNFGDSSPKTLVTLPAGSVVIAFLVDIDIAFVGTNPNVKFGDAADDDGYLSAVKDVGWYGVPFYGAYLPEQRSYAAPTAVIATQLGTGLSAGHLTAYIIYAEGG